MQRRTQGRGKISRQQQRTCLLWGGCRGAVVTFPPCESSKTSVRNGTGFCDDTSNKYYVCRSGRNRNTSTSMQSHPIPFRIELFVPNVVDLGRRQFISIANAIRTPTITKLDTCIILHFPSNSTSLKRPFIPHSAPASSLPRTHFTLLS